MSFGEGGSVQQTENGAVKRATTLLSLPDELLLQILSVVPGGAETLATVGATCRRLYSLSQQGVLWAKLFRDAGYRLASDPSRRIVATPDAPGTWHGREFVRHSKTRPSFLDPSTWASYVSHILWPDEREKTPLGDEDTIPVHFPTLFRARRFIAEEMQGKGPHRLFRPTPEDALPALDTDKLVIPNNLWLLRESTQKLYGACVRGSWAILGGRGGGIKIWYIPPLPLDGSLPEYGPSYIGSWQVHDGSVVSLDFVLDDSRLGNQGLLVTGSRDLSAKVWAVDYGKPAPNADRTGVNLRLLARLDGHVGPLTAVVLSKNYIVTGTSYPDGKLRVYDREEVYNSDTVQPLRVINATGSEPMPGGMTIGISSLAVDRYDKDSPMVLVGLLHAGCRIVNAETGEVIDTSVKPSAEAASVASVAIQSTTILAGCLSGGLIYSHGGNGVSSRTLKLETHVSARTVLLSDADHAITAGYHGRIHFWDLLSGEETRTYELQGTPILAMARDGMHLVAALADGTIAIITYGTGMPYLGLFA